MKTNKGFALISTFFIALLLFIGAYHMYKEKNNIPSNEPVACTADAKMCDDGSYVGRTGPNCEFVCPEDIE